MAKVIYKRGPKDKISETGIQDGQILLSIDTKEIYSDVGNERIQITDTSKADKVEVEAIDNKIIDLQDEVELIASASDVVDIVPTYEALQLYDTSKLTANDIVKVLDDEEHSHSITYYRWNVEWEYIGETPAYYSKEEIDTKLQNAIDQHYDSLSDNAQSGTAVAEAIEPKQDKTDNALRTTNKTVVEAINELNTNKADKINTYTKIETDNLLDTKQPLTNLENGDGNHSLQQKTDSENQPFAFGKWSFAEGRGNNFEVTITQVLPDYNQIVVSGDKISEIRKNAVIWITDYEGAYYYVVSSDNGLLTLDANYREIKNNNGDVIRTHYLMNIATDTPVRVYMGAALSSGSHTENIFNNAVWLHSDTELNEENVSRQHAEGTRNLVTGFAGHAEGGENLVIGNYAHAQNRGNEANGNNTDVAGYHNRANYSDQSVVGRYNDNKEGDLFEVGCGTSDDNRKNALEVKDDGSSIFNGNVYIHGKATIDGEFTAGPIKVKGGDGSTANKIAMSNAEAGQITNEETATIFGFTSQNSSDLTVGHSRYNLRLRGKETHPKYNGNDIAMLDDVYTKAETDNRLQETLNPVKNKVDYNELPKNIFKINDDYYTERTSYGVTIKKINDYTFTLNGTASYSSGGNFDFAYNTFSLKPNVPLYMKLIGTDTTLAEDDAWIRTSCFDSNGVAKQTNEAPWSATNKQLFINADSLLLEYPSEVGESRFYLHVKDGVTFNNVTFTVFVGAETPISVAIKNKQDKLNAGTNITIDENNVISASGGGGTVDQTYDPTSQNAQSGTAVAEAISSVPTFTPSIKEGTDVPTTSTVADYIGQRYHAYSTVSPKIDNWYICVDINNDTYTWMRDYLAKSPKSIVIGNNREETAYSEKIIIGEGITMGGTSGRFSTTIGYASFCSSNYGTAIGGYGANIGANAIGAIQLGTGQNTASNTFSVGFNNIGNYRMLESDGTIPIDRTTIRKTTLDNVLVPNANYDLGSTEQASITLTLPTPTGTDNYSCNEIYVAFKSGSTATTLSIVGTYAGDTSYVPNTNSICELSFKYVCGTWVLVAKDTALPSA